MYLLNFTPVNQLLQIDRIQLLARQFPFLPFTIYLLVTFLGAYILYRFIERPFMNLRDRISLHKIRHDSVGKYKGSEVTIGNK